MVTSESVRVASQADIDGIVDVHVTAWQAAYRGIMPDHILDNISRQKRRARWQENLRHPIRKTIVYDDGSRILGFASYGPCRDEDAAEGVGELMAIYVAPDSWHRGIGHALWQVSQAEMIPDFSAVTVWVLKDNSPARQFYEAMGFLMVPDGKKVLQWYDVDLIEVRYRKILSDAGRQ